MWNSQASEDPFSSYSFYSPWKFPVISVVTYMLITPSSSSPAQKVHLHSYFIFSCLLTFSLKYLMGVSNSQVRIETHPLFILKHLHNSCFFISVDGSKLPKAAFEVDPRVLPSKLPAFETKILYMSLLLYIGILTVKKVSYKRNFCRKFTSVGNLFPTEMIIIAF